MEDIGSMIDNETDRINLGIPSQYNTRVADLGEMQNKILVSFLKHESVANNSNPSINLYEALKKRKESTGTTKGAFGKVAYNTKFLSALNNIPQGAFLDLERLFECEEKLVGLDEVFYQSVFAHMAREAAMRSEFTPKMIDSLDFRKTIYREIFPDRDQFEWYKGADVKIGARIAESSKYIVEAINEKVKQKGILGKVFGRSAKSFLKSFASEDINGSLEKKYEQVRSVADKIYSTGTISM